MNLVQAAEDAPPSTLRVGLDIGGTNTDAVVLDERQQVIAQVRISTEPGVEGVLETVREVLSALRSHTDARGFLSIGIGIPGQVDPSGSTVRHALNLGLSDLNLRGVLEAELGVPVSIENDVKAAALGAYALRGSGSETLGYLNLGTGVAAAAVLRGEIWRGASGAAGEIGHASIDPGGPRCACGQRGCIEAFAGGGAVARRWRGAGSGAVHEVFDAAETGDPHARRLRDELAWAVAAAVRLMVLSLDVPVVVLGGGVAGMGPRLLDRVTGELIREADSSPFLRSLRLDERVEMLPPGSQAASWGAALVGRPRT
ncbi:ROK family protein [Nesterenkonia xinjiangensis]|uniref:Putative NBD/HSP70 family sugar kinase n=1 Tax=Nesterenkonia xinjiangensis TaxID=225327 RepID=A0A7Z0GNF4_9MICC|nr:ROK family protein [Nesterenkonia xinjiangensis]NYJ78118.1 putative NBD/HSP70 family sugar kinase [Nesterenkonia xinjiangensis]